MPHFKSYDRIAESPSYWLIDEKEFRRLSKLDWIVTEKIHGANFCLITDGTKLWGAKRKAVLSEKDDFFHVHNGQQLPLEQFGHFFQFGVGIAVAREGKINPVDIAEIIVDNRWTGPRRQVFLDIVNLAAHLIPHLGQGRLVETILNGNLDR